MKRTANVLAWGACLQALALLGSGCGANRVNFAEAAEIHLEQARVGKVYVAWSDAYQDDEGFVVAGVVRRSDTVGGPIKVNVHAAIVASDGEVIDEARSDDISVPRRSVIRVQGFERFKVRLSSIPPEGTSVRVGVCSRQDAADSVAEKGDVSL
jgi:hypothetical protein